MVSSDLMVTHGRFASHLTAAGAAGLALLVVAVPSAAAVPESDAQGYVDSTARCATAEATVLFGSTENSRVAICSTPAGKFEYRGVRLSDGARLIVPATRSDSGAFVAENAGIEYLVTAKSLAISQGQQVIREEPMVDFHGPGASEAPKAPATPLPPPLAAEVGGGGS